MAGELRSVVCEQLGHVSMLRLRHGHRVPLAAGHVRVRLQACGLNFPDLLMVEGKYQHKPALPFTPGLEGSGTITEVAADVKSLRIGDEVIVGPCLGTYADEI